MKLTSIKNAANADNNKWTVTASNLKMGNGLGVLFGKITHNTDEIPIWGEDIGYFPDFSAAYQIPLLLYANSGAVHIGVIVNSAGKIKMYNPDLSKFNVKGREYDFYAIYLVG